MAAEACYSRPGWNPRTLVKTYMESPFSSTGYAWYGVAQMEEDIPVIFHYSEQAEIWTQRSDQANVYSYFDEQTDDSKAILHEMITGYMIKWNETGYVDWDAYG